MNKVRTPAPLPAQQRAKDLKTNTRKSTDIPVIQVNSPELMFYKLFWRLDFLRVDLTVFKRKNNLRNGLYFKKKTWK